ncbi:transposon Ty3-I Gag-Pol polyprotein [Nephila pilipes]|uniref:Transposon Ty3-I Gag-Pol polyprotein n=1 Tax=Nephila pilipes TaxID=299642 RepID=A0A8X6Q343_NEPPI|nr:transposon Ty3-I Gag-Pol polyprotein [Nephila pilipes]
MTCGYPILNTAEYTRISVFRCRSDSNHFISPQSNEAVERFHRLLKSALRARLPDSCLDAFPLVLLGIWTCYNDYMVATSAELVYGTALKLPGEFFSTSLPNASVPEFLQSLRCHVRALKPVLASRPSSCPVFISKDLFPSPCIFLRLDRVRRPLEPSYAGPYKVVKRTPKIFTLGIDGKQHTVSMVHLKPILLFPDTVNKVYPSVVPSSDIVTRFGRRSRPVVRFQSSMSSRLQWEYNGNLGSLTVPAYYHFTTM